MEAGHERSQIRLGKSLLCTHGMPTKITRQGRLARQNTLKMVAAGAMESYRLTIICDLSDLFLDSTSPLHVEAVMKTANSPAEA